MNKLKDLKLKVGDKVKSFGLEGEVVSVNKHTYHIRFEKGHSEYYCSDGRLTYWHKISSLEVIERVKQKVKRAKYLYKLNYEKIPNETTGYYIDKKELINLWSREEKDFKSITRLEETEREFE